MDKYEKFRELADNNALQFIETTDGMNGYPQKVKPALTGFETFEEAEEFASEHGLETWIFHKRDGWQLWERKSHAYEPFNISAEDYGYDYNVFKADELEGYFEQEVKPCLENFSDLNDLKEFVEKQEEIMDELEMCDEGEAVITYCGEYYETVKVRSMEFYHDTNSWAIGVM